MSSNFYPGVKQSLNLQMVYFDVKPDTKLKKTQIYVALCFWETTLPQVKLGNLAKAGHLQLTACSPDANIIP